MQGYYNQSDSLVARGAAEQTYQFYGPLMMGMHGRGTTQAIGANCAFRRAALESIGGHASGLAEDMHTSMQLYGKGWRSVYVPEMLTRGLVPSTLSAFYKQQVKWACGAFDLLFQEYPGLFRRFTFWQRVHYLLAPFYFMSGLTTPLEIGVPVLCLVLGATAWRATPLELAAHLVPLICLNALVRQAAQRVLVEKRERGMHFMGGLLTTGTWWVYLTGVVCAVFRVKVPYIPTPKEVRPTNAWRVAVPNVLAAAACLGAAVYGVWRDSSPYMIAMAVFAVWNAAVLLFIALLGQAQFLETCGDLLAAVRPATARQHDPPVREELERPERL